MYSRGAMKWEDWLALARALFSPSPHAEFKNFF
jgi:hypothetical protein